MKQQTKTLLVWLCLIVAVLALANMLNTSQEVKHISYAKFMEVVETDWETLKGNTTLEIAVHPAYVDISYELAGKLADAEAALSRAVELVPTRSLFRENLARVYAAQGKDADALGAFRAVLERDENSVPALQGMAAVLLRTSDEGTAGALKAADAAERAVRLTGGKDPGALEILAVALLASGKPDKALAVARQAFALAQSKGDAALIDRLQTRIAEIEGKLGG